MQKDIYDIIKRPILTEKSLILKDKENKYSFEVDTTANKAEIRTAIEKIFKVKVVSVRTINVMGKMHRVGRFEGKRKDWKKAVVTLKAGQKIDVTDAA